MQLPVFMRQHNFFLALSKLSDNFLRPFFFSFMGSTSHCFHPLKFPWIILSSCRWEASKLLRRTFPDITGERPVLSQLFWHRACKCSLSRMELHMKLLKLFCDSCAVILLTWQTHIYSHNAVSIKLRFLYCKST